MTVAPTPAPRKLTNKIGDLTWEIAKQPGSGNFRIYHEDGRSEPVTDINTIILWEILRTQNRPAVQD
jgi:hypothetical protein